MKTFRNRSPQIPLVNALAWVVGSVLVVSGVAHRVIKPLLKVRLSTEEKVPVIHSVIQTGPQKEALKTEYLAQLLDLSADCPASADAFDLKQAEKKLRDCPLIAEAHVELLKPSTLYIDYTVRQPVAWLSDYENVVLDKGRYPFPSRPFFSPKNLPEIYIGMGPFGEEGSAQWNQPLQGKHAELAFTLLELLTDPEVQELTTLKRIDVSKAFAESYGTREIIVVVEDLISIQQDGGEIQSTFVKILRLSTKHFAAELGNFFKLREQLVENQRDLIDEKREMVIDLRIPNLAFVH